VSLEPTNTHPDADLRSLLIPVCGSHDCEYYTRLTQTRTLHAACLAACSHLRSQVNSEWLGDWELDWDWECAALTMILYCNTVMNSKNIW
jgi:hypothetical protein